VSEGGRPGPRGLPERLRVHLRDRGWWTGAGPVVVAFSGGLDSLVLLHLLRHTRAGEGLDLVAAHFDHRMREGSLADAEWVQGLCRAWGVPLERGRASAPPGSEGRARELRYAFLEGVRASLGGEVVLTAHHADDLVETVLFRLLRGTGPEGLAGIPEWREPAVGRPLLPFRRRDLEEHARRAGLRPRVDPSNQDPAFARNRIRREALPLLESIHPGARNALERIARLSRERSEAVRLLLAPHLGEVVEEKIEGSVDLHRDRFLERPPPIRAELLRAAAETLGVRLSEAGTATAGQFMREGSSGGRIQLPGALLLSRDFQWFRLERAVGGGSEEGLGVPEAADPLSPSPATAPGTRDLRLGPRRYRISWWVGSGPSRTPGAPESTGRFLTLPVPTPGMPLGVRGRRPGDRIRLREGTRRLKRLMGELRIPRRERDEIPLLVDRDGVVLWIPGRWRSPTLDPVAGGDTWTIGVVDAGDDT
jgi:tRNA(Ile)-lysidine synthase